jgi:hypothetical protein
MRSNVIVTLALCLLVLGGCATPSESVRPYGTFAGLSPERELYIASDVAAQLLALYPPAQVRLDLDHATEDAFGVALIAKLRGSGYAIAEYGGQARAAPDPAAMTRDQRAVAGRALRYIVDRPTPDLFRATVFIDDESLSRAYTEARGEFLPFGAWVRRHGG